MIFRRMPILFGILFFCCSALTSSAVEVFLQPETPSPGELFLIRLQKVPPQLTPELRHGAKEFRFWQSGDGTWTGMGAVDRDEKANRLHFQVVAVDGEQPQRELLEFSVPLQTREYPEQRLRVSQNMVHLSAEDQARAADENRLIRRTLSQRGTQRLWSTPFAVPIGGPITSEFGVRRIYNDTPRGYHSGLDIAAPRGEPVLTTTEGQVALVGNFFYTGNTVFIDHGLGLFSAYFHLDSVAVAEGEALRAGNAVGTVGSTGRSTGPHLHWGIYLAGIKADPLSLIGLVGMGAGGGETP